MDKKKTIIIFNQNVALFFNLYFLARYNIYLKIGKNIVYYYFKFFKGVKINSILYIIIILLIFFFPYNNQKYKFSYN